MRFVSSRFVTSCEISNFLKKYIINLSNKNQVSKNRLINQKSKITMQNQNKNNRLSYETENIIRPIYYDL